jgi:2-aminoethylphosphonate-pyruvate transaminase
VRNVRGELVALAGADTATHTAVPMQGSGTFTLEAVASSVIPRGGKLLVGINGAYGHRMAGIAERLDIVVHRYVVAESAALDAEAIGKLLDENADISHVAVCHCETTSGVLNDVAAIGVEVALRGRSFIVDAMSSFGAIPLNVTEAKIDCLVSSANKCIEGVPGFAFVIARTEALLASRSVARSVSLDLLAQYEGLEKNGQFRFTPPTHVFLAFAQALRELAEEGGVAGRGARYAANHKVLCEGMTKLGFRFYLDAALRSPIITSFYYPQHPNFDFEKFYEGLSARDCLIYPGKVGDADCFRIGSIGRLFPADFERLLSAIESVLNDLKIPVPLNA